MWSSQASCPCLTLDPFSQPFPILRLPGLSSTLPRQKCDSPEDGLGFGPLPPPDISPPPLIIINHFFFLINHFLAELLPWVPHCASRITCPLRCSLKKGFPGQEVWEFCTLSHNVAISRDTDTGTFLSRPPVWSPVQLCLIQHSSTYSRYRKIF